MQLLFSLPSVKETKKTTNQRLSLRRAIAKWLWENKHPDGMATDVATKNNSLKVDLAALWSTNRKTTVDGHRMSLLAPAKTAVVIGCLTREDCWPECSNADEILGQLSELKHTMKQQEAVIRQEEPHLRDDNMLFEEYAVWNYDKTSSQEYHRLKSRLTTLEMLLFRGTRLARIRALQCANWHYLAVPEGVLDPQELVEGWGLLSVNLKTETATLLTEPAEQESSPAMTLHLMQNMIVSASKNVNDMLGLKLNEEGSEATLVRPPSIHHK